MSAATASTVPDYVLDIRKKAHSTSRLSVKYYLESFEQEGPQEQITPYITEAFDAVDYLARKLESINNGFRATIASKSADEEYDPDGKIVEALEAIEARIERAVKNLPPPPSGDQQLAELHNACHHTYVHYHGIFQDIRWGILEHDGLLTFEPAEVFGSAEEIKNYLQTR